MLEKRDLATIHRQLLSVFIAQWWKGKRLLDSGRAHKKHRSCYSTLTTSKRLSKLKNQQLSLEPKEKWGHRSKSCSQSWRYRETNTKNHTLLDEQPWWKPAPEKDSPSWNWWIAGGAVGTTLSIKNSRETKSLHAPHICEFYLLVICQSLTVNTRNTYTPTSPPCF